MTQKKIIKRFGKLILLFIFLTTAAISGCNWNDGSPVGESTTLFENRTNEPIHLYVDTVFVDEIGGERSYFHEVSRGEHTYSAKSKYYGHAISGGVFVSGGQVTIP